MNPLDQKSPELASHPAKLATHNDATFARVLPEETLDRSSSNYSEIARVITLKLVESPLDKSLAQNLLNLVQRLHPG